MIDGGQVDGLRPDGAQLGRHLQPQLVAVGPQRPDSAQPLPGVELQAGGALVAHVRIRSFLLLHHITRQVSPPAGGAKGNKMQSVLALVLP